MLALGFRDDILAPLVSGVVQGSVYGLLGLGLVLLYKGNRLFNFAQGEFGTMAAFAAFWAYTGTGFMPALPYPLAILLGLVVGTLIGLGTERFIARPLFRQPKVTLVVASAGVGLLLIAVQLLVNGANPQNFKPLFGADALYQSGALQITPQQVTIVAVLAILASVSALFFSRTRLGVAILAVSQEPTATSLVGISVHRISALTWGMAGFLGAVAGILLAPQTAFTPGFMTVSVLIPAFTAAVFGGITSLPGAFLGGAVIGIVEQFGNKFMPASVPGANRVVVFVMLLLVLLVKPSGLLGKEA